VVVAVLEVLVRLLLVVLVVVGKGVTVITRLPEE